MSAELEIVRRQISEFQRCMRGCEYSEQDFLHLRGLLEKRNKLIAEATNEQ